MQVSDFFPVWEKLTPAQQSAFTANAVPRELSRGTLLHNGSADCTGVFLVRSGQLRAYILSEEGREITLYRLFAHDLCLFSASCMMRSIQFDVFIEVEKDASLWLIPVDVYRNLMNESAPIAIFTNEIMASRFSDVMWLIEQVMWKSMDRRIAAFLLEEAVIEETDELKLTHETIANHLGTHREVVTRMLRYFQSEGMVTLSRGTVALADKNALARLSG